MILRFVVASLALAFGATSVSAGTISFTESAIASGSLGSTPFTDTLVILTTTGNTSSMVSPSWGVFELEGLAISIYIGSLGTTANLTNPGYVFAAQVDPSVGAVGFGGNGTTSPFWVNFTLTAADILNSAAPAFSTYNLTTSIGPITDSSGDDGAPNPYIFFSTNEGWLQISSVTTSTFSATLEPITIPTPEPTTMALFGLGLACLAVFKRRT